MQIQVFCDVMPWHVGSRYREVGTGLPATYGLSVETAVTTRNTEGHRLPGSKWAKHDDRLLRKKQYGVTVKHQNTVQMQGSLQMAAEVSVGFPRISEGVSKSSLQKVECVCVCEVSCGQSGADDSYRNICYCWVFHVT